MQIPIIVLFLHTVNNWVVKFTAQGRFITLFSFCSGLVLEVIQEHRVAESESEEVHV